MDCRAHGLRLFLAFMGAVGACSGGAPVDDVMGSDPTAACSGLCAESGSTLGLPDLQKILAQGIAEAVARGVNATLAVVDRVGHVLAVYRMGDKQNRSVTIASEIDKNGQIVIAGGLEGLRFPVDAARVNIDDQAAIAKAITGAYLSSEGNAFSTRTAAQIVQNHFNVQEKQSASGPLFGVQISQLACSDVMGSSTAASFGVGPQRSPLGLSADPGGFPLYKNGTLVGGVGVMADGVYGVARSVLNGDTDIDESIAYAATYGFAAPIDRRADRITADGKTLRFSNSGFSSLRTKPADAAGFSSVSASVGSLTPVTGYFDGTPRAGTVYGQTSSGIRADREGMFSGADAFVLVDASDVPRFVPRSGTDAARIGTAALAQSEVVALLRSALMVANRTRAQIRRPPGAQARVTIALSDTEGAILGIVQTRDAPVFGVDVALQKARSAAFFSSERAGAFLTSLPEAKYLRTSDKDLQVSRSIAIGDYLASARDSLGDQAAFSDGRIAYSARAIGNLSRPFFPDGIDGALQGVFSKPAGQWSVLSTGLQLDLSINAIFQHIFFVAGATMDDVTPGCTGVDLSVNPIKFSAGDKGLRLGNGLQIFPGGVPIYRASVLVGAVGVSGDGVDQDDMIAFLGVHEASKTLGGSIANAPVDKRADVAMPRGVRLRYVQCPQSPFRDNNDQRPCADK